MAGGLSAANNVASLAAKAGYKLPGAAGQALGDANSAFQLYNAFKNPTAGNVLGGVAGAANLYKQMGGNLPAGLGSTLGNLGYGMGILNAFKNPSAGNVASGAYDAYKLYNALSGLGAAGGAGAAAGAGTLGAGYTSAVGQALGADLSGAAGSAGSAAGGAMSALGTALPVVGALTSLYSMIQSDKQASSPLGQMAVLAQNGPMGQAIANDMITRASKYGDPKNESSWDISKWSAADQFAVNYGKMTIPQPKHGKLLVN